MSKTEKKLKKTIELLNDKAQKSLLDFALFLASQEQNQKKIPASVKPKFYPGEANETVIGALKRLQKIYSMINTNDIFNDASRLMTEHMMQGRDAVEVIAEMEQLFANHYQKSINVDD